MDIRKLKAKWKKQMTFLEQYAYSEDDLINEYEEDFLFGPYGMDKIIPKGDLLSRKQSNKLRQIFNKVQEKIG